MERLRLEWSKDRSGWALILKVMFIFSALIAVTFTGLALWKKEPYPIGSLLLSCEIMIPILPLFLIYGRYVSRKRFVFLVEDGAVLENGHGVVIRALIGALGFLGILVSLMVMFLTLETMNGRSLPALALPAVIALGNIQWLPWFIMRAYLKRARSRGRFFHHTQVTFRTRWVRCGIVTDLLLGNERIKIVVPWGGLL